MKIGLFLADAVMTFSAWYATPAQPAPPPPVATADHDCKCQDCKCVDCRCDDADVPRREPADDGRGMSIDVAKAGAFGDIKAILESHLRRVLARGGTAEEAHASVRRILAGSRADLGIEGGRRSAIEGADERDARLAIGRTVRGYRARIPGDRLASLEKATGADDDTPSWKAKISGLDDPPAESTTPRMAPIPSKNPYASPQSQVTTAPYQSPAPVRYVYAEPAPLPVDPAPVAPYVPPPTVPVVTIPAAPTYYYVVTVPPASYAVVGPSWTVAPRRGLFGGGLMRPMARGNAVCVGGVCAIPQ